MRVLYLSYDGLTDPLGQSQILPYLIKLAEKGHQIDVISFEKPDRQLAFGTQIQKLCTTAGLGYYPQRYRKWPPVLSTLQDIREMKKIARQLHHKNKYHIVHCRSYIAALVGEFLQQKHGVKFIFDMRGFYADERVDGGIWPQNNLVYRKVYQYFKRKERDFLNRADHIISLTHAAKTEIEGWKVAQSEISVIPCCVDTSHFDRDKIPEAQKDALRSSLHIINKHPVVGYVGSTGTWYLLDEMLMYFKAVQSEFPQAVFLFVTVDSPEKIVDKAREIEIPESALRIVASNREDLPAYLSLMDWSVFFIQPVFSKKASSPTKQGELMSMGIPVVCNSGVGDTEQIVHKFKSGITLPLLDAQAYQTAAKTSTKLLEMDKASIISGAKAYFSLEKGVAELNRIYLDITK